MTAGDAGAQVIDGRFELIARLGGGGMGLVWRARDLMLQREVALKEVRSPDPAVYGSDPSEAYVVRERVLREAQALARLHHPNVVTIHHIVDSPQLAHPWLVMELVTGGSLEGRLDRGTLTVPEAVRIGRGVLAALRAAHAAGIQHRDVKPANVLLRADGTPVLTDFGIAALEAQPGLTATGMLIGSPEYMAPERIHGREGDPASDLWSLGIMLYVGLEGHNPLRRETTIATIAAVSEANVPAPKLSGALTPVLGALLVKDPARRPTTEQLDRMFAEAERYASVTQAMSGSSSFTAQMPGMAGVAGMPNAAADWPPTAQFENAGRQTDQTPDWRTGQHPVWQTDQTPGRRTDQTPAPDTNPVANPYGGGTGPKRRHYVVSYGVSAVFAIGMAGTIMYMSHTFGSPSKNNSAGSGAGPDIPSFSAITAPGKDSPSGADTGSSAPSSSSQGGSASANVSGKALLTGAGARAVIASAEKASGSSTFVEATLYDDGHAIFDIVKKDDPGAYDSWEFTDGQTKFWTKGGAIRSDQKTFDPSKVNWDALPAMVKDGNATLKVKNPTLTYVIANYDPDFLDGVEMDLHITSDYYSGFLQADINGKIIKRHPQE